MNNRLCSLAFAFLAVFVLLFLPIKAQPRSLTVGADGQYATIDDALEAASDGDIIEVHGGTYPAPLEITKSVVLRGIEHPVIDGEGEGSLIIISAPDVVFEGFTLRNTGTNLSHEDSAIIVQADRAQVLNNTLEDVLFGIYFADANDGIARGNIVRGYDLELALRGDGIRVWFSHHVLLEDNEVTQTRDTLIWFADDITIKSNNFHGNRYGLHFMYSDQAWVERNQFTENSVGTYLMYSRGLTVKDNFLSYNRGPSGYGLALKDMDEVVAEGNWLVGNRAGLYIDNSPSLYEGFNDFTENVFAYNDIGITIQPSVQRNRFSGNAFLENTQQAGTRGRGDLQKNIWTQDGIGNYWSDYVGYDADGDAVGDIPYRSEKLFENLADSYPVLRVFLYSPASQAIDLAAAAFPSLRPAPKLIDDAPLVELRIQDEPDSNSDDFGISGMLITALAMLAIGCLPFVLILRRRRANDLKNEGKTA